MSKKHLAIPNVTQVGNGQRQALVILPSHCAFYGWTQEDCSHVSLDVPCQEHLLLQYRITKDHPKTLAWKVNSNLWCLTWLHCIFGCFPSSDLKGLLELSNHCYAMLHHFNDGRGMLWKCYMHLEGGGISFWAMMWLLLFGNQKVQPSGPRRI